MKAILFTNDWYDQIISQTQNGFGDDISSDAHAIASSLLIAGCCIAQSIDNAFGDAATDGDGPMRHIASAIERLADAAEMANELRDS